MNGFGGFLNKEFRVHDYFLGRYNCKIFLRDYFTIPEAALETNPIFRDGYAGMDKSRFKSKVDGTYQIIPVFFQEEPSFPSFKFRSGSNWPVIEWKSIHLFKDAIKKRVEAVLFNVIKLSTMNRFLLWIGSRVLLRRIITNVILRTIKKELFKWHLLDKVEIKKGIIDKEDQN